MYKIKLLNNDSLISRAIVFSDLMRKHKELTLAEIGIYSEELKPTIKELRERKLVLN